MRRTMKRLSDISSNIQNALQKQEMENGENLQMIYIIELLLFFSHI